LAAVKAHERPQGLPAGLWPDRAALAGLEDRPVEQTCSFDDELSNLVGLHGQQTSALGNLIEAALREKRIARQTALAVLEHNVNQAQIVAYLQGDRVRMMQRIIELEGSLAKLN
jgi:hypothetical protein